MEALQGANPPQIPNPQFEPDTDKIKRRLTNKGVYPTPKIVHALRKKQIQKHNRKLTRLADQDDPPLSQQQALYDEAHFQTLKAEYREFNRALKKSNTPAGMGMPWAAAAERFGFRELASSSAEFGCEKLRKKEELKALREMFETQKGEEMKWALEDDIEVKDEWFSSGEDRVWDPAKRRRQRGEGEVIQFLVDRLSATEFTMRDWKLSKMMKQSGLEFTEGQLLKILNGLGAKKCWKQAMSVVDWVYKDKANKHCKSRFVYTKLLAILGKARRPQEALVIFNTMRGESYLYPDSAAYHSIAVTLGQTGHLKELLKIIEYMKQKPFKIDKNMFRNNWDPTLEPDVVVYNAILNACVQSHQWKSVYWVFNQLRKNGLKPNGATYGLAMEVMLQSRKYELVHELFRKMKKSGEAPKALNYKAIVRALWCEGKLNEAVEAVRDMERRGVVGTGSVYYELACCLCKSGRWQDALLQVEKMKNLSNTEPLEVTFTGMIRSSMEGGHIDECISIFEHMKNHCTPNIGTINTMLKVYGRTDMFSRAKDLFEEIKTRNSDSDPALEGATALVPDEYTYTSMLKASACALQWEYFEYVYKEMALCGYQIDQRKHASILVEASRAGKGYLLEHAFDTALDAGIIPHQLFFIEMVVQATAQHDYKRAASLVNTMAYAPFQVSEKQWTNVFQDNKDRISQEGLEELLHALQHCDVTSEATLVNLEKSLQNLCRSSTSRCFPSSVSVSSRDDIDEGSDCDEVLVMPNHSLECIDGKLTPDTDSPDDSRDAPSSTFHNCNSTRRDVAAVMEIVSRPWDYISDEDGGSTEIDEEIEALINEVEDSHSSGSPSAKEIMKEWKEQRKKDGIILPFQLGQK